MTDKPTKAQRQAANQELRAAWRDKRDLEDREIAAGVTTVTAESDAADLRITNAEKNVTPLRRWLGR